MTESETLDKLNELFNSFLTCKSESEFVNLQKVRKELFLNRNKEAIASARTSENKKIVESLIEEIRAKTTPDTLDFRRLSVLVSIILFIEDIENGTN